MLKRVISPATVAVASTGLGLFKSYTNKEEKTPAELRSRSIDDGLKAAGALSGTAVSSAVLWAGIIGISPPIALGGALGCTTFGTYSCYKAGEAAGELLKSFAPSK